MGCAIDAGERRGIPGEVEVDPTKGVLEDEGRKVGACTSDDQRQKMEEKERELRVDELVRLLKNKLIEQGDNPASTSRFVASRFAMGRELSLNNQAARTPWSQNSLIYAGHLSGALDEDPWRPDRLHRIEVGGAVWKDGSWLAGQSGDLP